MCVVVLGAWCGFASLRDRPYCFGAKENNGWLITHLQVCEAAVFRALQISFSFLFFFFFGVLVCTNFAFPFR